MIVDRSSRYGNPFDWRILGADEAVRRYAEWIVNPTAQPIQCGRKTFYPTTLDVLVAELGGRDLACFCKLDAVCHADVLLRLANE